jgi:hypothetical protein
MKDRLACREARRRPVADIEEGYIFTTACILPNLAMKLPCLPRVSAGPVGLHGVRGLVSAAQPDPARTREVGRAASH